MALETTITALSGAAVAVLVGIGIGLRRRHTYKLPLQIPAPESPFKNFPAAQNLDEAKWRQDRVDAMMARWLDQNEYMHKLNHEWSLRLFESVIASGSNALKSLVLLNGAAIVALLSFAVAVIDRSAYQNRIVFIRDGVEWFVAGVGFAVVASALTYLTQTFFSNAHNAAWVRNEASAKTWAGIATGLQYATVLISLFSFILFTAGVFAALHALG